MSISVSSGAVVNVYVHTIAPLKSGNLHADGSEQTMLEYVGSGRITGYVDLSQMQAGDSITVRQYIRVLPGGSWSKYAEESYSPPYANNTLYVWPRECDYGMKITLQQTLGVLRSYPNNFVLET